MATWHNMRRKTISSMRRAQRQRAYFGKISTCRHQHAPSGGPSGRQPTLGYGSVFHPPLAHTMATAARSAQMERSNRSRCPYTCGRTRDGLESCTASPLPARLHDQFGDRLGLLGGKALTTRDCGVRLMRAGLAQLRLSPAAATGIRGPWSQGDASGWLRSARPRRTRGGLVDGKERLQMQFRQGDVGGGGERRQRGDQA